MSARLLPGAPAGVFEVDLGLGLTYLVYTGRNSAGFLGWYYGYSECCVDAFAAELAARRPVSGDRHEHPESGHILCPACVSGPMAPLRDRPAELYGVAFRPLSRLLAPGREPARLSLFESPPRELW